MMLQGEPFKPVVLIIRIGKRLCREDEVVAFPGERRFHVGELPSQHTRITEVFLDQHRNQSVVRSTPFVLHKLPF